MIDGRPRFLIVRLGSLGDVIHAIPAVAALRRRYPQARIDWVIDPGYLVLLRMVVGLDDRIGLDTRGPVGATVSAVAALRRHGYDMAFDLQGLLKSAAVARSAGATQTVGFARDQLREPMARLFYTHAVDAARSVHVIEKNLDVVAAVGVTDRRVMFPLDVPQTAVSSEVGEHFGRDDYAMINPGAAWPNKRWPATRFGQLAAALQAQQGLRSLVVWGPGEQVMAESVVRESRGAAMMSPPTSIPDLFATALRARVMVSGDTGPLHIAGAVGTPIVALFGPTRHERNGPWAPEDVAVSRLDQCVCHYQRRCRRSAPCIDEIGVDEVLAAVERRLRE